MPLTARSARIKAARRLTNRSQRAKAGRFLVEGPQALGEALRRPDLVVEIFATERGRVGHPGLVAAAETAGVAVHPVSEDGLRVLAETVHPQGLVGVCQLVSVPLATALAGAPRLVALLSDVRDPGNAGTVIRTADAAGADAVMLSTGSVDIHNGKCVRASAGSLFHVPIAVDVSLADAVNALRAKALTILAADADGEWDLDQLADSGMLVRPTAWIFGNEAWGLSEAVHSLADRVVRVPIYGEAESLNLATAAAVCLYTSARALRDDTQA